MLETSQTINYREKVVHGTALIWHEKGLLLKGSSGSGKSDLALRLIDKGARLIADDQVLLTLKEKSIVMSCPSEIKGKIEAFGLGILNCKMIAHEAPLFLVCALKSRVKRLFKLRTETIETLAIPKIYIDPFWPSVSEKLSLFLQDFEIK